MSCSWRHLCAKAPQASRFGRCAAHAISLRPPGRARLWIAVPLQAAATPVPDLAMRMDEAQSKLSARYERYSVGRGKEIQQYERQCEES